MATVFTVSEIINHIKTCLEENFQDIEIEGEVTNWVTSGPGHVYFALSDADSLIQCALFRSDFLRNPAASKITNGNFVKVTGSLSVYKKRGTFQLIVKNIVPMGEGELIAKFEVLKKKLASEGLFDIALKRKIPLFPKRMAIITAEGGAALQDFINVFSRRSFHMDLIIVGSLVQGSEAPQSIKKGLTKIKELHKKYPIDVVVLARGGGSLEDLWAFNDESLARDIASFEIPIVSAIGHQTDFSISDYVADLRAETPTAAAEILSQWQTEILAKLENAKKRMAGSINKVLSDRQLEINKYSPRQIVQKILNRIHSLQRKLFELRSLQRIESILGIHEYQSRLDGIANNLQQSVESILKNIKHRLNLHINTLKTGNPKSLMERGFCYIKFDGKLIGSKSKYQEIDIDSRLEISFYDGKGIARKT